ncbi:hypothetical protein [Globicatella sanguinis]|uniref:hypothetical protein n=1 Tax=Globicatella sanguinis TaxID=13076 RepID=UPI0008244E5A|nr:hypothetical protein [Globicatella sanguinis]
MKMASKFILVKENQLTIMGVEFSSNKRYRAALYAILSNMIEGWKPTLQDVKLVRQQTDEIFDKYGEE